MTNVDAQDLFVLKTLVDSIAPFPAGLWSEFSGLFEPYSAKRKICLTAQGEEEKFLYVVLEGVQRVYFLDQNGREATLVFTYPPSFAGVLDAMMLGGKSRYYFETLTTSRFLRAHISSVLALKNEIAVSELLRLGLSGSLSGLLERLVETQVFSSEEKFRSLLRRSPHILNWIPHKYLANYLGIDPTNFSKLINSISI